MVGGWAAGVACCGYINCWCYGVIVEQCWLANYTRMPTAHKLGQRPKQYGLLIERSPLGNLIYRLLRHGLGAHIAAGMGMPEGVGLLFPAAFKTVRRPRIKFQWA